MDAIINGKLQPCKIKPRPYQVIKFYLKIQDVVKVNGNLELNTCQIILEQYGINLNLFEELGQFYKIDFNSSEEGQFKGYAIL